MAKRAKPQSDEGEGVRALRGNGYDSEQVQSFVERIENVQSEIDAINQQAKDDCETHRQDIKDIKSEAKEAGIPAREFNALLSRRRKIKAAEALREKLSDEQKENFDQLCKALGDFGDTELGKSALHRATPEERAAAH